MKLQQRLSAFLLCGLLCLGLCAYDNGQDGQDTLQDSQTVADCVALLGQTEQQLVEALGEGQRTLIEGTQETLFREYSLSLFGQSIPFMATIDLGCLLDFSADVDGTCEQWLETIEGSLGEASQTQQDDATQYLWPCEGGGLALVSSQDALTLRFYREQPAA